MNRLKELRTRRLGLTQRELATKLNTTQQTVARWEAGQAEIPIPQLKDLAILFDCSVDDLLGIDRLRHQRPAALAQARHGIPFGALTARFPFGLREYPIDQEERDRLDDELQPPHDLSGHEEWLEFVTLNNKLVFFNLSSLSELHFVSDAAEETPYHASPEVYRSLTTDTPTDQLGPITSRGQQELAKRLAPGSRDPMVALETARREMHYLRITFTDGKEETFHFSKETAEHLLVLRLRPGDVGSNAFLLVEEEGHDVEKLVNLSNVAVIEAPFEAYLDHVAEYKVGETTQEQVTAKS